MNRKSIRSFKVNDRVSRKDGSKKHGVIVELTYDGRCKIKWDEVQRTGQQHSTINPKFLIHDI